MHARFLTRSQVAEELNISMAQAYALIRRGELRAAKIGARGETQGSIHDPPDPLGTALDAAVLPGPAGVPLPDEQCGAAVPDATHIGLD
jgi:excisionase family DNA binding protein